MKAARIHRFGPADVIVIDELPRPVPPTGQVLLRVASAGVGPWDALIREKKSVVDSPLPLTLGSDVSGAIEAVGAGVTQFKIGDAVYGATNPEFIGAYAEFALASATMVARKPSSLSFNEAASVPVVAVTASQMLYDYAKAKPGQTVLIHGAAGSVGAYAVQLASQAGLHVFATASSQDTPYVQSLGAKTVIDYKNDRFENVVPNVDIVLDTVGGDTRTRSLRIIKPSGILVSVVSEPLPRANELGNIRAVFFLVEVTTERLDQIAKLFDRGKLVTRVGTVLPLEQARTAHEMLAGAPHKPGKIVLSISDLA
ncbi:MAG: NADP-dependent oxidoreductase [Acidobacteriaceae bacterium]|nr:NADP-dependent oxidoreductase [Acidobacteriaceae bacterium]MBV9501075.1 NADP-dependent oxidoreductase [Acidobacteriaceae bacterium]